MDIKGVLIFFFLVRRKRGGGGKRVRTRKMGKRKKEILKKRGFYLNTFVGACTPLALRL